MTNVRLKDSYEACRDEICLLGDLDEESHLHPQAIQDEDITGAAESGKKPCCLISTE